MGKTKTPPPKHDLKRGVPRATPGRSFLKFNDPNHGEVKVDITPRGVHAPAVKVPCGDCHICCHLPMMLTPNAGDNVLVYQFDQHTGINPKGHLFTSLFVKREKIKDASEGDLPNRCIYLTDEGCQHYEERPASCRAFDCRKLAAQADKGDLPEDVIELFLAAIEQGRRLSAPVARRAMKIPRRKRT